MAKPLALIAAVVAAASGPAFANEGVFPERMTDRPRTTDGVPHVQIGVDADPRLSSDLLRRVGDFPGVELGPTRVSLPGATGFQLRDDVPIVQPEAIVGGREFAHLHPDGSLHASLDPKIADAAVLAGWATPHPWANQRAGWEGFVMIYTPITDDELAIVIRLVKSSYTYITGRPLPD